MVSYFCVFIYFHHKGKVAKQHMLITVSPILPKPPCQLLRGRKPEYTKHRFEWLRIEHAAAQVKDKWFSNSTSPFKPLDWHGTEIV